MAADLNAGAPARADAQPDNSELSRFMNSGGPGKEAGRPAREPLYAA